MDLHGAGNRIVLALFVSVTLLVGLQFAGPFPFGRPALPKMPRNLQTPAVLLGSDLLTRTVFLQRPSLGKVTDLRPEKEKLGIAGTKEAVWADLDGSVLSSVTFDARCVHVDFIDVEGDGTFIDVEGDGTFEFLNRGGEGWQPASLLDQNGRVLWKRGDGAAVPAVNDMPGSDLDGDGIAEFVVGHNGGGGVRLLDRKRAEPPVEAPKPDVDQRLPTPTTETLAQRRTEVRELLRDEFTAAGTPAGRTALAAKLIKLGGDTNDDPTGKFALLMGARDLAARAGDMKLISQAVQSLAESFQVDRLTLHVEAMEMTAEAFPRGESGQDVVNAATDLIRDAMRADRYADAERLRRSAETVALRWGNTASANELRRSAQELETLRKDFAAVQDALKNLESAENDPELNRIVGEYLCFSKGNWERGLPYLRKVEGPIGELAKLELSVNPQREAMLRIADGWWVLYEESKDLRARNIGLHAQFWYSAVLPQLSGLTELRVRKRIDEAIRAVGIAKGANGLALPGPNAVTKGHFTAWSVPPNPDPGENYMIVVRIELPPNVQTYPVSDLSGIIEGTDRYRQSVGGKYAKGTVPVSDGKAEVKIMVPGAARLVRDRIRLRSAMLNEEQTLEIVF